jgi:integrase
LSAGFDDPISHPFVQRVILGADRLSASSHVDRRRSERMALPTSVVAHLVAGIPSWIGCGSGMMAWRGATEAQILDLRDAAVISLGLRLMRRPGELAALAVDDVEWSSSGAVITVRRSKTDQLGVGLRLPVDASGTSSCPVVLLRRWLAVRSFLVRGRSDGVQLFVTSRGKPLSTSSISSIVARAASRAGLDGRFSGHSLRIGGATAAMAAGASMAQIKAVGGWASEAVRRYLRPASVAFGGLSVSMGL